MRPLLPLLSLVVWAAATPQRRSAIPSQAATPPEGTGATPAVTPSAKQPVVTLTWDGTGDFGPHTPNTRTSGWQEALAAAAAAGRDVYVQGGSDLATREDNGKAVYFVDETVRIPPSQDFRIDGGVFVVAWRGTNSSADVLVVDSCMNCYLELGTVVTSPGQTGAAVALRPTRPVPMDGFPCITECRISMVNAPASSTPFQAKVNTGVGLLFDTTAAAITSNHIHFGSILNFETNILANTTHGQPVASNTITIDHLHTNAFNSTLAILGPVFEQNWCCFGGVSVDQGANGVVGVVLGGRHNVVQLAPGAPTGFLPAKMVVLSGTADGNTLQLLASGADASSLVTDAAALPTNRLEWDGAPPAPTLVPLQQAAEGPGGLRCHTQRLFPAAVFLRGATVPAVPAKVFRGGDLLFAVGSAALDGEAPVDLSLGDRLCFQTQDEALGVQLFVVPR